MSPMPSPQLLLHGLGPVFAPDPAIPYKVDRLDAAALQIEAGRISRWMDDAEAARCLEEARKAHTPTLDARGRMLLPGFVDSHSHPVFFGHRAGEYEQRNAGRSYLEIQQAGGGILASRRSLQGAPVDELTEKVRQRLRHFAVLGTTTLEAKSGYGLSVAHELLSLRLLKDLQTEQEAWRLPRLHPTLLAAHSVPPEFRDDREGWFSQIVNEILPTVVREGLAEAMDAFCEPRVITVPECERLLRAAKDLGLGLHLHADQLESGGGGALAARLGALSADHLENINAEGIRALVQSGTVCGLLPGSTFFLGLDEWAPARTMIREGAVLALATDFNPGSSHIQSMPLILTLATCRLRMSAAEAVWAATAGGARALGQTGQVGCLEPGARADLCLWPFKDLEELPYKAGDNRPDQVLIAGRALIQDLGS